MRRTVWGLLIALAAFAGAMFRLRRISRPRFEVVRVIANGRVRLGRVVLARGSAPGKVLGWSIECGGHEVLARTGQTPLTVLSDDASEVLVQGLDPIDRARIDATTCAVRSAAAP